MHDGRHPFKSLWTSNSNVHVTRHCTPWVTWPALSKLLWSLSDYIITLHWTPTATYPAQTFLEQSQSIITQPGILKTVKIRKSQTSWTWSTLIRNVYPPTLEICKTSGLLRCNTYFLSQLERKTCSHSLTHCIVATFLLISFCLCLRLQQIYSWK
jgi:hypothetical protein